MAYTDRIAQNLGGRATGLWPWEASITAPELYTDPRALYWRLKAYYQQNSLYEDVQKAYYYEDTWIESMRNLRGVGHRVVEFYVNKIWPGALPDALPIITDNQEIIEPLEQVWKWSNWANEKQVWARWFALYGNTFTKVVSDKARRRVYFQNLEAEHVVEIDTDERGFLTFIRLDIPRVKREDLLPKAYMWTEVWDHAAQSYTVWEHQKPHGTPLSKLGSPKITKQFSDFGVSFVPIVHGKFQDTGEDLGMGAFTHALDKIDEANRMSTRLHQLLYRFQDPVWAVAANSSDSSGRPLPAPRLQGVDGQADNNTVKVGTSKVVYLPGMSSLELLIPDIRYADALAIIKDHMDELEKDLPELAYSRLREIGEGMSGVAIRNLLSDTVDKVVEVRGNAEIALARLDAMALTVGKAIKLPGFEDLGEYDSGDLDHTFGIREIIPMTELERMVIIKEGIAGGLTLQTILPRVGYSASEVSQAVDEAEKAKDQQGQVYTDAVLRKLRANQASYEANGVEDS